MPPQENPTLDPKVLKVLRGIRTVESGGDYNAIGDNGSSAGAFQWSNNKVKLQPGQMPARFLDHAKESGVQVSDFSKGSQNKVAYSIMKKWKDEGLQPEEIAAKWNGAKKDPTTGRLTYVAPEYGVKFRNALGATVSANQGIVEQPQGPVQPEPKQDGFLKSAVKGLVSPVATMLARPFQAGAELMGASAETVNEYTKGNFGDWVAPVPQNFSDVKKDVGRGLQTVALGLPVVSSGAAFGAGMSLEEGNDLASWDTLAYTVSGAALGKGLDLLGKPLLNYAGKQIGKITPQVLQTVAAGGVKAVEKFMLDNKILPDAISSGINKGAAGLERGLNAPFNATGKVIKSPFVQNDAKVVAGRAKAFQNVEEKYSQTRDYIARDPEGTAASRDRVARSNVLTEEGMINEDGVIIGAKRASEAYEAEKIGQGNRVVKQMLKQEGVGIDMDTQLRAELERVMRETFDGAELKNALNNIGKEIEGLRIKRSNGRMILDEAHELKISSRPKGKDYDDPTKSKYKKALSRGYKETVEKYSKENIREINAELEKFYGDREYILRFQGKRIESGKLGKAVARVGGALGGAVVGGAIGGLPGVAAGSYVGGIVSSKLAGRSLQKAFGKPTKLVTPKSKVIGDAVTRANAPRNQLMLPAPSGKTPILLQPPKGKSGIESVKVQSYVDRDPKTGKFRKVYLSGDSVEVSKVSKTAYKSTVANGGVTISLDGGMPTKGLAYAPYKGTERIIPQKDFNASHVETFTKDHAKELAEPGNHLGMWVDDGKVYMDISKVGPDSPETLENAMKASQLAVFNLESFETVTLGEIKNGRYIRTYGKTANNNGINKGEVVGGSGKGGDGKLPKVPKSTQAVSKGGIGKVGEGRVGGGVGKKKEINPSDYKTAEDFVAAQGTPVYRGGVDLSKAKITNSGISVSSGKNVANDFVKQKGGTVQEHLISPEAKIINYDVVPNVKFKNLNDYSPELDTGNRQIWRDLEVEYQKAVDWAKAKGYDGVKFPLEGETRIINPEVLKTKSQLIDIWNKAKSDPKNFKTAKEFVKAKTTRPDYGYGHSPNEDGVRAFDLTEKVDGEQMIPSDMYEQWYGSRGTPEDLESIAVLKKIKGNPESEVTIYRASPKDEWNYGDWTTFSKKYADSHAEGNNLKVFSKKVKAKDVRWAMDDVNEFGYFPEDYKSQLIDIWNKANKTKTKEINPKVVEIAQFTEKGKEGKFWTTPEGADTGFGSVKKTGYIDVESPKLFKGQSSERFLRDRGLLDNKRMQELTDKAENGDNPNMYYKWLQDEAEEILKKEGYSGAYWKYEDDLNPTQYQIWDKSLIRTGAGKVSEIGKYTKVSPQHKIQIDNMYKQVPKADKWLEGELKTIAEESGSGYYKGPVKKREKVESNLVHKYGGNIDKITDIVRGTVTNVEKSVIELLYKKLTSRKGSVGKFVDAKTDPLGYNGWNVRVKAPNGMSTEIQINTPKMIYAKEEESIARHFLGDTEYERLDKLYGGRGGKGHTIYDEYDKARKDGNIKEMDAIAKRSKLYYNEYYD